MGVGTVFICSHDNWDNQRSTGQYQGTSAHREHKVDQIVLYLPGDFVILSDVRSGYGGII